MIICCTREWPSRSDDEQPNPWQADHLAKNPVLEDGKQTGEEAFYELRKFRVRTEMDTLAFPPNMLVSDNYFRPRWVGIGDRRLKSVGLVLEWIPQAGQQQTALLFPLLFRQMTTGCGTAGCTYSNCKGASGAAPANANQVAAQALGLVQAAGNSVDANVALLCPNLRGALQHMGGAGRRFLVVVSLAEGETIRRAVHSRQSFLAACGLALRTGEGRLLDTTARFAEEPSSDAHTAAVQGRGDQVVPIMIQLARFLNGDMYYTPEELKNLVAGLSHTDVEARLAFFSECQRLRRRERHLWNDTSLAKVFTPEGDWHLLHARAMVEQLNKAFKRHQTPLEEVWTTYLDTSSERGWCSLDDFQYMCGQLRVGMSAHDMKEVVTLLDEANTGRLTKEQFLHGFKDPVIVEKKENVDSNLPTAAWQCMNCSYVNTSADTSCLACEWDWTGTPRIPKGKWMCDPGQGGCTFFNTDKSYYCEQCDRARPDLRSTRF